MNFTKGEVIAINKPLGMTSFGALAFVRNRICKRLGVKRIKIGHAGTLDPLATGVLVLCTGRFTKRIEEFQLHGKEYVATLQFGATTPSYDMEHPVNETFPTDAITRESLEQVSDTVCGRHRTDSADVQRVQGERPACLRPPSQGRRRRAEAEAHTHRQHRTHGFLSRNHASHHPCGVRKGNLHPSSRTRHRTCSPVRSLPYAALPHQVGRQSYRELPVTRHLRGMARTADHRD